ALGDDRAVVGISAYDPDLSPWRFNVYSAYGAQRSPVAAAVFTERGIYRPGEEVFAKAIVRRGPLGALVAPRGDSLRWIFTDRADAPLRDTVVALSAFGTDDQRIELPSDLPLGSYRVQAQVIQKGRWQTEAEAYYRVAEYRPPEFLVDVTGQDEPRLAGDSATFRVSARYLFGAPMGHAPVRWTVQLRPVSPWAVRIPGAEAYRVGRAWNWWDRSEAYPSVVVSGSDTLDLAGGWQTRVALPAPDGGRPARATFTAVVTDANRQIGSASAGLLVHPAAFYIGVRPRGEEYFWTAGTPVEVDVIAVEPEGRRVEGIPVSGTVVRREWHRVRRQRNGYVEEVGGWVADTVAHCSVRSAAEPTPCAFTPPSGGSYTVEFTARDARGREVGTSINRWASGEGWVPWNDESKFKMDVIPDRERYVVGDTATVLLASPFTDAEAWVTVEREQVLEQRRVRLTDGATTLRFPVTEAFAPNVFVSVVVVRGRSAEPGPLDDPGRPTMRVGYAELRVTPEVKRLAVDVTPARAEYRPGEEATFALAVHDGGGAGQRAEVTLWAVDEGVLALTGYTTPDPIDLVYPPRGLGMRLASNLVAVAPQIPEGQKGSREPGGGGGGDQTGILRSRFETTAFFLGSVVTDEDGAATARARLPDNVTTFRVMAVAVTQGDRYGSGESEILVTRPLLARSALPRFVREGDRVRAGVVVNSRLQGTPRVDVEVRADGIEVRGDRKQTVRLEEGRGAEVRFDLRAQAGDSARLRFTISSGKEADGVAVALPVRPNYHPLTNTVAGVVHDTATAEFRLQPNVDPRRSRLEITFGVSPLTAIRNVSRSMRAYPWACTEQISSAALPLIALLHADALLPGRAWAPANARADVEVAVRTLIRRQRADGGIGYWGSADWSSPWLSAWAGGVLLAARDAGIPVADTVFARLGDYMARALHQRGMTQPSSVSSWWTGDLAGLLREQLAAADLLSRLGRPDVPVENTLLGQASRLHWEDRVLLAQVLARRGEGETARQVLASATRGVRVEGRTVVLPDSTGRRHYFASRVRPAARLLEALLTLDDANPLVGPLVETLVTEGRVDAAWRRNTQDQAFTVLALARYEAHQRARPPAPVRVVAGGRTLLEVEAGGGLTADTSVTLEGLVESGRDGPSVRVSLAARGGTPVFYFVTVHEAPDGVQPTPVDRGIQVERWYESLASGTPVVAVDEGEVVRVRLRVTVPSRRSFVVLDDPLPAGLEPVDLSLRTVSAFGATLQGQDEMQRSTGWYYGSWDSGMWSAFDHKELRDDRVVYAATLLWPGTYDATYLARATAAGTFLYPPAHAEEMYNPGVNGRTGGGEFTVRAVGR
ncbi:MAG TPA: alpha-2-macroglobulin family protein, partial [Longimicrobiales bacterium]|nr:alpha-2-macroglobulin family protein [Longimicrobiales bacterium]